MPADTDVRPAREDVRARAAVAAMFFTNGALIANLIPRYPEIKAELGMGNSAYGLAVAAFPAGAIVAGLAAGVLVRRFGSARVAVVSTALAGLGVIAAGLAPVTLAFAAAGFVAGAMDSITDVAQNAHGLRVQRRYGRSIINSFHAVWSIGAVTGGAMSAGAIALGIDRAPHLIGAVALLVAVALVALRFSLPGPEDAEQPEPIAAAGGAGRFASAGRVVPVLAALVLIATAGTLVEDAGNSWAAIYLGGLGAPAALAASGYIALVGTQFIGRISGDRLVDRFGQRTVARAGGVVVAVGFGLALALPTVPGTVVGFAAAGLGIATLVPAAMHEADELPGLRPGTGLTVVSWLMRLGFLLSPPVVGLIADASSLRLGLVVVPIAGALVVLLAGVLKQERANA